jgi:hypothetical protein
VPSSDDNQDHPKTLPSPELNPLTNPVLGRNMGRWAEVYFTSPPERREQAVQELLRELERDAAGDEAATPSASAPSEQSGTDEDRTSRAPDSRHVPPFLEGSVQCPRCGEEALPQQKFCSACGAPLAARENLSRSDLRNGVHTEGSSTTELGTWEAGARRNRFGEEEFGEEKTERLSARATESVNDIGFSWERAEKSIAAEPPILFADHRRARRLRNRALMAAAFVILVGTFFYVAGRETAGWVRATHELPRAASAETHSGALSSPAQETKSADRAQSPIRSEVSPVKQDAATNPAERKPSGAVPSPQLGGAAPSVNEQLTAPSGSQRPGSEELAVAESLLSGVRGKTRDSGEAAKWLWKAVAKQNAEATLLLSDLYVRGDGVPQNCDQARLLLDAAASKGVPGAGERIRELPKVGCQ